MFFCFTIGTTTTTSRMKNYKDMCFQCQACHQVQAIAERRWTWFTLCYLPLFPVYMKKTIYCPHCKNTVKVSTEQLDDIRQQGPAPVGQQPQQQYMQMK